MSHPDMVPRIHSHPGDRPQRPVFLHWKRQRPEWFEIESRRLSHTLWRALRPDCHGKNQRRGNGKTEVTVHTFLQIRCYFLTYFLSALGPTSAPKIFPAASTATPSAALVL